MSKRLKNKYKSNGSVVYVDVSTKKHNSAEMIIDRSDWDSLMEHGIGRIFAWKTKHSKTLYASFNRNGRQSTVHGFILGHPPCIDHENHDGLDNRRKNIHDVTHHENSKNRLFQKNNTSGITGVYWYKPRQVWEAKIQLKGQLIHLGRFVCMEDAVIARRNAELQYGFSELHGL